jgi:hypothetical protein
MYIDEGTINLLKNKTKTLNACRVLKVKNKVNSSIKLIPTLTASLPEQS